MNRAVLAWIAVTLAVVLAVGLWLLSSTAQSRSALEPPQTTLAPRITLAPTPSPAQNTPAATAAAPVDATPPVAERDDKPLEEVESDGHLGEDPVDEGELARPADEDQRERYAHYADQAVAFVIAYSRTDIEDPGQWWARVAPFLSAQARDLYRDVDPGRVPFTRVTGPARVIPAEAPEHLLVPVHVPTDAGVWLVEFGTDEHGTHVLGISRVS